ncbi:MAG: glutamine--fructose-6-phosphate transaminase (isomerizing) [Clostridiales Family XIII bacterium]|jgi:glucosamine--fructose-6-phosphate aminotransferase (isomerizing)|nr:glutamine--fructose-6-phosphate transaminase (isomerizing) [Clostridiales Family XIII bacterium]
MCGIVGYVGDESAKEIIISGLKSLEYRGYDSAGIALNKDGKLLLRKESGVIGNLEKRIKKNDFDGNIGIGHTRWATHGAPIRENAHPHLSCDGRIAIVHNGIIENYMELKSWLIKNHNVEFKSETDSEVIAQLICVYYNGDLVDAVRKAVERMRGAYAIGAISADDEDRIVAVRKDAPLIAGIGKGCNYLASDIPALLKYTRDIYLIENGEIVVVSRGDIKIFDEDMTRVKREKMHVTWDAAAAEKGGYEHFMKKEIYEQPEAVNKTLEGRINAKGEVKLDGIKLTKKELDSISRIYIVACGTAYHAGMQGKELIENFARIPTETDLASEFRYRDPIIDENTLFICVSQSGETSDTIEAMREAKRRGARILSICNVVGSSITRESDDVLYTWAGPEIAVASTKAYTTQLVCFFLLALYMGKTRNTLPRKEYDRIVDELKKLPAKMSDVLGADDHVARLASKFAVREQIFYIGRGSDVGTAYEASLKLKEISYINSFAIAAGELKHGTIALINRGTLFVVLATQDRLYEKMLSNIEEIKARHAYVVGVAKKGNNRIRRISDDTIMIPECSDEVAPILAVVPMQLFAYHIAKLRKRDIDKPRNLAKSVTVE